jgi:hypothetical protein
MNCNKKYKIFNIKLSEKYRFFSDVSFRERLQFMHTDPPYWLVRDVAYSKRFSRFSEEISQMILYIKPSEPWALLYK